ncbi:hypothetical protein PMAYCL1PPCAC_22464, partial [Pristionchus mayeri]
LASPPCSSSCTRSPSLIRFHPLIRRRISRIVLLERRVLPPSLLQPCLPIPKKWKPSVKPFASWTFRRQIVRRSSRAGNLFRGRL